MNQAPRRATLAFIFFVVMLDVLAMGIIIPVLPKLVESFVEGDTARAAQMYGVFGIAWAAMQFVFSPLLGALSDRYGRRPVVLISCFGLGLDYILMALAPNLAWLFVGRLISGITAASISTAFAYIADVTPAEKRAASFGMVGAAFGVGFVLGPALGGLLGHHDIHLPFWVAAGLSLLNAVYGLFVLPESLPPEKRAPFRWSRANPFGAMQLLRSHPQLPRLATIGFLIQLAHVVLPAVTVLYMSYRYGFDPQTVGLTLAGVGVFSIIVQGGLVKPVVARIGERHAMMIGLLCGVVGFSIYGLATEGWIFWSAIPLMSLWGLASPALQGLMSQRVADSEQGRLQGATTSLQGIAGMIGPGLFTQTFALFIGSMLAWHLPGAPFFVAAGLLLLALVIAARIKREN